METIEQLVENNLKLVHKTVYDMLGKHCDDAFQEGCLGLWMAAKKHNPDVGKLSTLAVPAIRWRVTNFLNKDNRQKDQINYHDEMAECNAEADPVDNDSKIDADALTEKIERSNLSSREKKILELRYDLELNIPDRENIEKAIKNCSRQRRSQIHKKTIDKIIRSIDN